MNVMDKVNNILGKLPFVKLAGKIPSGILGKIPVLNTLIPFANHAAVVLLIVVLAACFGGGGGSSGNSGGASASAQVANGGEPYVIPASDFEYELSADSKGVKILEYTGPGGNIILPTEIEGLPIVEARIFFENVTSAVIPDYYLPMWQEMYDDNEENNLKGNSPVQDSRVPFSFDDTLENITFPKGIKYIPHYFFESCKALKSYTIPDTVTGIGQSAFIYSGLTSIVIPEGVTYIAHYAFEDCDDLKSVTLPESIQEIGSSAFDDCDNLEIVNLPSHKIVYDGEDSVYSAVFGNCEKLSLATQKAIRDSGYTNTFAE